MWQALSHSPSPLPLPSPSPLPPLPSYRTDSHSSPAPVPPDEPSLVSTRTPTITAHSTPYHPTPSHPHTTPSPSHPHTLTPSHTQPATPTLPLSHPPHSHPSPPCPTHSYTAYTLGILLTTLATRTRRLVVVSLHQPSSQLFAAFHSLLLLANGKVLFHGPPLEAVPALERMGAPRNPDGIAPSDHLLHICVTHVDGLKPATAAAQPSPRSLLQPPAERNTPERNTKKARDSMNAIMTTSTLYWVLLLLPLSLIRQVRWLGWRCIVQLAREPSLLLTQLIVHLAMAGFMVSNKQLKRARHSAHTDIHNRLTPLTTTLHSPLTPLPPSLPSSLLLSLPPPIVGRRVHECE